MCHPRVIVYPPVLRTGRETRPVGSPIRHLCPVPSEVPQTSYARKDGAKGDERGGAVRRDPVRPDVKEPDPALQDCRPVLVSPLSDISGGGLDSGPVAGPVCGECIGTESKSIRSTRPLPWAPVVRIGLRCTREPNPRPQVCRRP